MAKSRVSLIDKRLLDLFSNSYTPDEVEQETGIPALQAVARTRELLASIDVWDEVEQRRLLAHSLKKAKEQVESIGDMTDPKLLQSYTNLVGTIDKIQDKARAISDQEIEKLAIAQGRHMLNMIEASFFRARELLSQEYPEVDLGRIDTVFWAGVEEQSQVLEIEA
jgi:hypothetical protein